MENSPKMPTELFKSAVEHHSHVVSMVVGPELPGWPVRRPRLYSIAIRRESLAWVGPDGDAAAFKHFCSLLTRKAMVDAEIFAELDSAEAIAEERAERAANAGLAPEVAQDSVMEAYFKTDIGKTRVAKYREMLPQR